MQNKISITLRLSESVAFFYTVTFFSTVNGSFNTERNDIVHIPQEHRHCLGRDSTTDCWHLGPSHAYPQDRLPLRPSPPPSPPLVAVIATLLGTHVLLGIWSSSLLHCADSIYRPQISQSQFVPQETGWCALYNLFQHQWEPVIGGRRALLGWEVSPVLPTIMTNLGHPLLPQLSLITCLSTHHLGCFKIDLEAICDICWHRYKGALSRLSTVVLCSCMIVLIPHSVTENQADYRSVGGYLVFFTLLRIASCWSWSSV